MKLINLKKSVIIFGTLAFLFVNQSCKDVLNEEVISQIGNSYIDTPKGFNDAVNAAYSSLRAYYGSQQGLTMTEYGTDLYATGADGGYKGFHFYDTQLNPSVDWLAGVWDELYRGINTCNAVIDRSKTVTGISDAVKAQRVAECKYLRGLYYFILFQQYGPVDLRLSETLIPTKVTSRATDKAMFDAILADLEAAVSVLPAKATGNDYGRATKPACEHLLGYVYLTKNNTASKAADDLTKATTNLADVVNNTAYGLALLSDYASVFDENNQVNSEVVFACQYTTDAASNTPAIDNNGNTGGNNLHLFFGMQYDVQVGMKRDVFYGRPFKRLRPTKYLIETAFADKTNDSRFKKSFRDTWLCNNPGTYSAFALDNSKTGSLTYKAGDTTLFIAGYEMPKEERALRKYQVIVPSLSSATGFYNEAIFYTLTKFFDTKRPDLTYTHGSRDYFVFRLADTKLLLAEAYFLAGKRTEALKEINDVRTRAAFAGKAAAMQITDAQLSMEFIMEERARELAGEQIRWMDLKRWGKLVERVKAHNPQAAPNVKDIHYVRPIPQTQIDRTENKTFAQNPGY
jgi:starch-binding outer membrane protein, SusD/RagB family